MPFLCARRTKRRPECTVSDEPSTSSARADSTSAKQRSTIGGRDALAEEHDVRLEHAAAAVAVDDVRSPRCRRSRRRRRARRAAPSHDEAGVRRVEPRLHRVARA